jgi:hypothetical protein
LLKKNAKTLYIPEALQISISKLQKCGYLEPGQIKSGTLTWTRNGHQTGSISIQVNTISEQPHIELDYKYRDEPRNYIVSLVSVPSNLGKGKIWYFLCPHTRKRCRKLYSIGGYFFHREAFNGCMYDCQTKSKYYRKLNKILGPYFKIDQLYEQLYSRHFKKYYSGKPTKRYLRILNQIENIKQIDYCGIKSII